MLTYFFQGMILNNLKRYSLALESFDKAIELAPNEANAYADKAIVLSHMGKYDLALETFQINKALELNPEDTINQDVKQTILKNQETKEFLLKKLGK